MNILESYSLQSGLKIDKPYISDNFFPSTLNKYVTFHSHSKFDSRNYDYLHETIALLKQALKGTSIEIVQLGTNEDPHVSNVVDFRNRCNINQTAYMIKNSMAHFGVDSFLLHLASYFNVPFVGLYSNMHKEQSMPLWGEDSNRVLMQSDRGEAKPSYAPQESPKTINNLMPEDITNSVISLLGKKQKIDKINEKTIHIGPEFKISVVEVIPDFVTEESFLRDTMVNLRLDLDCNMEALPHWLNNRHSNLISKEPLALDYINNFRQNIKMINFDLTDLSKGKVSSAITSQYLKGLKTIVPNVNLFVRDKENLSDMRLKFFDWEVNLFPKKTKDSLDNLDLLCDNSKYKSAKSVISKGKQFQSISAWKNKIEYHGESQEIIDQDDFWQDINHYRIFN